MYQSCLYLSVDTKKVCHAHLNAQCFYQYLSIDLNLHAKSQQKNNLINTYRLTQKCLPRPLLRPQTARACGAHTFHARKKI